MQVPLRYRGLKDKDNENQGPDLKSIGARPLPLYRPKIHSRTRELLLSGAELCLLKMTTFLLHLRSGGVSP